MKRATANKAGTFQSFVNGQPLDMPTADVVKLALRSGFPKANRAKVHTARWVQRRDMKPATGGKRRVLAVRAVHKAPTLSPSSDPKVMTLRRLILDVGLDVARVVFAEYEQAYAAE